jgi:hypothetical protein
MMEIEKLVKQVRSYDEYIQLNMDLYDIFQGNLLPYVEHDLRTQLSPQSYQQAQFRIPPINVLRRIIEKLSRVYGQPPLRIVTGSDQERELFDYYAESFRINQTMALANAYFNLFKNSLLEPYLYVGDEQATPRLRVIPSDKFLAFSEDSQDPTVLTTVVIYQGKYRPTPTGGERRYFKAVDKNQFIYFDEDRRDITAMFAPEDNPDGVNPYGVLPYVYLNKSEDRIMPIQDTDTKRMAVLIPTLLADTNYASMFQAFSILYGIDVSDQGLKMAPNAFWTFKTEPGSDAKPEIGAIKPDMNVEGSLSLIASQLAFWLNSRGIRPGAIGEITASNFSSGISKMIDEMDTVDDRKSQVPHFKQAEESLWDLVLHKIHPVWAASGMLENRTPFAPSSFVTVTFPDQIPLSRRGELVKEAADEINAGLTTRRRAIQRINPELSEEEVSDLIAEIDQGNVVEVEERDDGVAEDKNRTSGDPDAD